MGITLLLWLLLILLAAALILAALAAAYFILYRRRINRALPPGKERHSVLPPPHRVLAGLAALLFLLLAIAVSYFTGYQTAYHRIESDIPPQQAADASQTFYAEITQITGTLEEGNSVHVKGLAVNDINYRGEFSFSIYGETSLEWRGTTLTFDQLEPGDTVALTFTGEVMESYPAILPHVTRIQLLDDKI